MPAQTNLNVSPYYDDFDVNNNFYKILFKAGYPVQARELTQSQTILQDQIEKLGSRLLKDGDNVVPGEFSLGVDIPYVKLSSITVGSTVDEFVGYEVVGVTSGVKATVYFATAKTDTDDSTLFLKYESSGSTSEFSAFIEGEILESTHPNFYTATVGVSDIAKPITSPALGQGSLFTVSGGSYFINGFIIRNDAQTIELDKYSTKPTYEVGFLVKEELITSSDDSSLLDNSQGSSNFAAPGADRLKISLELYKRNPGNADPNFIQLISVQDGNILGKPDQGVKWDWLYDVLAKRTYDESGDYIVQDFSIDKLEYWNDAKVDGVFSADDQTGLYPAVPGSDERLELTYNQADAKYALKVGAGKAYVQGYQVGYNQPLYVYGDKPRGVNYNQNTLTQISDGPNIAVTNVYGTPDFQNIDGDGLADAFEDVILYRNFIDGYVGQSTDANNRPLNSGNSPWTTYHIIADGVIGNIAQHPADAVVYNEGVSAVITSGTPIYRGDAIGGAEVLVSYEIDPVPSGVIKPRYLTPSSRVDNQNGKFGYNSTYKLGMMTSTYFTELYCVPTNDATTDWVVGNLVYGEESGAIAIVEEGSRASFVLLVSNVIGEFIPGEEVYQDSKTSRILKESEVYSFNFPNPGDLSAVASITVTALGSEITLGASEFVYDAVRKTISPSDLGREKLLNFPYPEGSALNKRIDYQVETDNGISGYAVLLDARITNTLSKTKSAFSNLADTNDFSCDISIENNVDSEVIDVANRSLFSGDQNKNFVACDNLTGDATDQLTAGDLVNFVDDNGNSISKIVLFATRPVGYGELRNKSKIYFTTALTADVTGKTVQRVRVVSKGTPSETLVFQLPRRVVSSLESDPDSTRISYQVMREHILTVNSGSSSFTLTTNKPNEVYVSDPSKTIISVSKNISSPGDPLELEGIDLTASITLTDQGRKAEYTFTNGFVLPDTVNLKVMAPIYVNNATAKRKNFIEKFTLVVPAGEAADKIISLAKADIFALHSVMMLNPGNPSIDVTGNYNYDNGQRDNVYQLGRLILKPGAPLADEQLTITFDYFEHTNEGDFFSVDSYTHDDGINYNRIPNYNPTSTIPSNNANSSLIRLGDAIDFRPIVNTDGANATVLPTITDGKSQVGSVNFDGSNSVNTGNAFIPRIPISSTQFQADIEYYLPKVDSLFLGKDGSLNLIPGEPADNPLPPPDLASGIRLYDIYLPPYTFSIKNSRIRKFNYKVYRMKDIGDINRRIDRIEELVTLSLLEQSAINMSVRDAVTGLERYKNGIVVDPFRDHVKGEINSTQYRNSIDNVHTHLRAAHYTDQVELEEVSNTDLQKEGMGYSQMNGIITCAYESTRVIQNPLATRFINLQPYSVFTYDGNLELTPSVDTWQVTNRLPDLVIEDNNLFNAFVGFSDEMAESGIGTQWGDWETTGSSSTTNEVRIGNTENNPNATQNALNTLLLNGTPVDTRPELLNEGGQQLVDNGGVPPIVVRNTTTSTNQMREQSMTRIDVGTERIDRTSYGDRVVDVKLADTMRAFPVIFQAYRLKPNTRYYAFFDDIEVTDWCSPDTMSDAFDDGQRRYTGSGGSTNQGFGIPLISDDVGTLTGVFLIPNGRAPVPNVPFSSTAEVEYQGSGSTRSFHTGTRLLKFTSHPNNSTDLSQVEGFAEANFYAQGVLMDKQETIVATRIPSFGHTTTVVASETRVQTSTSQAASYFDPVAQSFLIDKNHTEGVFVTELDIFFKTKDNNQPVEAYLVSTDGQVPTETILPHSRVVLNSDTILRTVCELGGGGLDSTTIPSGTVITGSTSGATGIVKSTSVFESTLDNPIDNVENKVTNLILSNYNGEFIPGEGFTTNIRPEPLVTYTIAPNEILVTRVDVADLGSGYGTDSTVEFSNPELPGGRTATATCEVGPGGEIFNIVITDRGTGYINIPSAVINSTSGSGAELKVRAMDGTKSVVMGVCTSEDATASTKFRFRAPVYLLGDTNYAFVVKAPTSLQYNIWTSKLGENLVGTNTRLSEQPNMGSLFMSQNGGLWTEDQTQDVTFRLWRADFSTNTDATVVLQNAPLAQRVVGKDPIETNNTPITDPTSTVFGDNPKIVRVFHYNHGLAPDDLVHISGVVGDPGGVPNAEINTLHTVIRSTMNTFTVEVPTAASKSGRGGGNNGRMSYNRPFEVLNVTAGAMRFGTSRIRIQNRATECAGLSAYNQPFQYRFDSPQDINLLESFYYPGAKQVANYLNEAKYNGPLYLQDRKSMETTITMSTTNSKVSPVLDIDRTNATVVRNLIDNPQPDDPNFGVSGRTITFNAPLTDGVVEGQSVDIDGDKFNVEYYNANTKKLRVSGLNTSKLVAPQKIDETALPGVTSVTATPNVYFIPETQPNGSVYAKWLSRLFVFENQCDGIEVKVSAIYYMKDSIKLYYRPKSIGFDGDITDINWIPFNGTGLPDNVDQIVPRSSIDINPNQIVASDWQSLTWTVQDTAKFDGAAFKIVMVADNPALAPLIDDIQIVASE